MPAAVLTLLPHFLLPKPLNSSGSLAAASFFLGAFLGAAPLLLPLLQHGEGGAWQAGVRLVFTVLSRGADLGTATPPPVVQSCKLRLQLQLGSPSQSCPATRPSTQQQRSRHLFTRRCFGPPDAAHARDAPPVVRLGAAVHPAGEGQVCHAQGDHCQRRNCGDEADMVGQRKATTHTT